jgi:hypothetical protein
MSQSVSSPKAQTARPSRISVEIRELPKLTSRRIGQSQIDADGDGGDISHE